MTPSKHFDTRFVSAELHDGQVSPEWLTYGHDYTNQRFSLLSQINTHNVSRLVPAYAFQTGVIGPFETSPIVADGIMYITTPNDGVFAINAKTGDQIWKRPPLPGVYGQCCGPVNRGVAIVDDLVLVGQLDGALVALDRRTGRVRWATAIGTNAAGYSITMAPLIQGNYVLIGLAGGEFGIRGSLSSLSLRDGRLRWRWYVTDPKHWFGPSLNLLSDRGRVNAATSARLRREFANSWKRGGGGIWTTPALDESRDTIYLTTGNPWPDENGKRRPGDNLFTDSIVALDASNGHMKWYFQETPHDTQDLDAASPAVLLETKDDTGRIVPAVAEVGKTGFLYILNRDTGTLIRRSQNVASIANSPGSRIWEGGSSWSPISFDPSLGYMIVSAAQHLRMEVGSKRAKSRKGSLQNPGWNTGYGSVSAVDPATGRFVWQDKFGEGIVGGSVSTAGGLTFVGEGDGFFDALETSTGLRLWRFQTGAGVNAPPIVFEVGNQEYIAVASGGNQQFGTPYGDTLFVFKLQD